jgi:hypothetical protein
MLVTCPGRVQRCLDMSESFTKLFSSITLSSVWHEDDQTLRVWITLLALADRHGYVGASVPGLATAARVPIPKVEEALAKFMAPDPYSRSKEHEGRRIAEADRGWSLLNYQRFRDMRDEETRRAYERERKRQQRSTKPADSPGQSRTVPHCLPNAEAEAEAESQEGSGVIRLAGLDGAPGGATPKKVRKARTKPAAILALEAALRTVMAERKEAAPALSQSLAAKAAARVSEYAQLNNLSVEASAALLARSWAALGTANAWKLCDVAFAAPSQPRSPRAMSFADREGRAAELRARLSVLDADLLCARLDGKNEKERSVSAEMDAIRKELRELKGASA